MALTTPRGPLGTNPAGWFDRPIPEGTTFVEPHPRRVQAVKDGRIVIDTERALLVHRPDRFLQYAFPAEEVGDLPCRPEDAAPGYVRVKWTAVDAWLEEGRELVDYPPNPYHRIDIHPTSRRLRVELAGSVVVDTDDTTILFETTLDARLYVERRHVALDVLQPSPTRTYCNYKGWATFWSIVVGDSVAEDAVWSYENPRPEASPIAGLLSFDQRKLDVVAQLPPSY